MVLPSRDRQEMVRDPFGDQEGPDFEDVLDALDDDDCRAIVKALEEPMTASGSPRPAACRCRPVIGR